MRYNISKSLTCEVTFNKDDCKTKEAYCVIKKDEEEVARVTLTPLEIHEIQNLAEEEKSVITEFCKKNRSELVLTFFGDY